MLHPECLAGRIAYLRAQLDALDFAVFPMLTFCERPGDRDILWNIDKPVPDLVRFLRLDVAWSITSSIWKSQAVKSFGAFDVSLPGWQDWQLHVVALLESLRYARAPSQPDSYCRAHGGRQISKSAELVTHVSPKTKYLKFLMTKYHNKLRGDETLRAAAAGLMWYQIVQLERAGMLAVAVSYWWSTYRLGYINGRIASEGILALLTHGKPGASLAWAAVRRWPNGIANSIDRSTCHTMNLTSSTYETGAIKPPY
jgi:hypothetical protein